MKMIHLLAAFAATLSVAPASAQTASNSARSMTVRTGDLDLTNARGLARLDLRVHRAAVALCGKAPDYDVPSRNTAKRCVATVTAEAGPKVTAAIAARQGLELAAANR